MTVDIKVQAHYLCQDDEVVVQAIEAGRIVVKRVLSDAVLIVKASDLKTMPEHPDLKAHPLNRFCISDWEEAEKRANLLDAIIKKGTGISQGIKNASATLGISARHMWRLYNLYKDNPLTSALLDVKTGRRNGARFLGQALEELIQACIDTHYLKREKPNVAALCDAIEAACHEAGLKAPSRNTIRKRVKQLELRQAISKREGKKRAGEMCDGAAGHLDVDLPLRRIEIDHTLVDAILRDDTKERKVRGRPWLTLAIDVKTRIIMGFYISFEYPSAASVAMCIAMVALPKQGWLDATGVAGSWPAYGKPKEIWTDNAMEFRSTALQRGCEQHQIQLCYRPVGSPQIGGTIERLIGTMMGQVHLLPGTTQSNVVARGDYDSEARATMTLSEFIPWFTEQVVTGYHLKPHRTLGIPPLRMWEQATQGMEIKAPRDPREYYASFLPAQTRVLARTGVQLDASTYWSDDFSAYVGQNKKVTVHFHRMDAEKVYVRLPDGRMTIATNTRSNMHGLTFADAKFRREGNQEICRDPGLAKARHEGFRRNQERLALSVCATKEAKRAEAKKEPPHLPALTVEPARLAMPSVRSIHVYIND